MNAYVNKTIEYAAKGLFAIGTGLAYVKLSEITNDLLNPDYDEVEGDVEELRVVEIVEDEPQENL